MFQIAVIGFLLAIFVPGAQAAESETAADLYRQAEEGEWLGKANMKDVDDLYGKAAEAGDPRAFLSDMRNRIAFADPEKQERLAEKLCPRGREIIRGWQDSRDADVLFLTARYYADGICENRDAKKGREYLKRAAEAGSAKAQYFLGQSLRKKDGAESFKWFAKAAEAGLPQAQAAQGSAYLLGQGVKKDGARGMELIEKALASENSNAMYDIAIWYLQGSGGLPKNAEKAREILQELVSRAYEPARAPLADIAKPGK